MNIFLWILQAILCIKLLDVAYKHGLRRSLESMQAALHKLGGYAGGLMSFLALCALLAALGLVVPGLLGLPAWLTPAAALFSAGLLTISLFFHLRSREHPKVFVSLVLAAFALAIAYGRWFLAPL